MSSPTNEGLAEKETSLPPLSQMIRSSSPKGFAAVESPPDDAPVNQPGRALGGNPYIRCPLPPFNATIDTMRQFNENGKIPTRRVIPLPTATTAGGGNSITNTTVINQGSGGGGASPTTAVITSVTVQVPALTPGQRFLTRLTMNPCIQLVSALTTIFGEVRIYSNATVQQADAPRATDAAPPFELTQGLITDVVFDTAPLQWTWQNRIAVNSDSPRSSNFYVTVINPSLTIGTSAGRVTISYLPLES